MKLTIPKKINICAVTKGHSIKETEAMLKKHPEIRIIAENRWPDCEEKFKHFSQIEKHFIGPLQSNKVRKVLPLIDVIQSVDSIKLMDKLNVVATELNKTIRFCIQVNISDDTSKQGIKPEQLDEIIEHYLSKKYANVVLIGLMTIGAQIEVRQRARYFAELKKLFDQINKKYFTASPLPTLSMGMSDDYETAIQEGATMVRIGRLLYEK